MIIEGKNNLFSELRLLKATNTDDFLCLDCRCLIMDSCIQGLFRNVHNTRILWTYVWPFLHHVLTSSSLYAQIIVISFTVGKGKNFLCLADAAQTIKLWRVILHDLILNCKKLIPIVTTIVTIMAAENACSLSKMSLFSKFIRQDLLPARSRTEQRCGYSSVWKCNSIMGQCYDPINEAFAHWNSSALAALKAFAFFSYDCGTSSKIGQEIFFLFAEDKSSWFLGSFNTQPG